MIKLISLEQRRKPSPERVANYLYLMILRKDDSSPGHRFRIKDEVSLIRELSKKVYKKVRGHRVRVEETEDTDLRYVTLKGDK